MASANIEKIRRAVKKRQQHILDNLDTLTMKQFRAILEDDMGLPEKSLREHKDAIEEMVDELVTSHKEIKPEKAKAKSEGGEVRKQKETAVKAEAQRKRQKKEEKPVKAAAGKQHSRAVEKVKKICKQAGIKIPPNIYRGKEGATLEEAFDNLLEKHDLARHSSSFEISLVAKRLQKERELEGIDTSNILENGRRSRPRIDYSAVLKSNGHGDIESESEEAEKDEQDSDESSARVSEAGSDADDISPEDRPGRAKRQRSAQLAGASGEGKKAADKERYQQQETRGEATADQGNAGGGLAIRVKTDSGLEAGSTKNGKASKEASEARRQPLQEFNVKQEVKAEPEDSAGNV